LATFLVLALLGLYLMRFAGVWQRNRKQSVSNRPNPLLRLVAYLRERQMLRTLDRTAKPGKEKRGAASTFIDALMMRALHRRDAPYQA
jgi:hypothetical protein